MLVRTAVEEVETAGVIDVDITEVDVSDDESAVISVETVVDTTSIVDVEIGIGATMTSMHT